MISYHKIFASIIVSILLVTGLVEYTCAQENFDLDDCTDTSKFCNPKLIGMPRSKAIFISYEEVRDFNFKMTSNNEDIPDNVSEVEQNQRLKIKFKVPLIHKKHFKVLFGFKYFKEKFNFDNFDIDYHPVQNELEDRPLKSLGGAFYFIRPFKNSRYLAAKIKGDLNGDFTSNDLFNNQYLKSSLSVIYGIKASQSKSYGFGLSVGYNFARPSIYPLIAYNKTFNLKWGIESLLPSHIKLRHNINDKNILYLGTELQGSSYNIFFKDTTLSQIASPVFLQQSEIRFYITYEKEIHDFLWFGVSAGLRENIEFTLSSKSNFKDDAFVSNNLGTSLYFNASLFFVIPKKFIK